MFIQTQLLDIWI